jgi:TrmH family RNA methyltransferase
VIEGLKLCREALSHRRLPLERALISTRLLESQTGRDLVRELDGAGVRWRAVSEDVFRRASEQASPEGIVLIARRPAPTDWPRLLETGLVVVVAGVQEPGNLGAIARVAEAAGARALLCAARGADPYQSKALRGSMGSLLRLLAYEFDSPEPVLDALGQRGFRLAACLPRGGAAPWHEDLTGPLAFVLGSESSGLPDVWQGAASVRLTLPMSCAVESLNVAVVAGVVLYEALRQRGTGS